jgi:SAM-dependent methyltransferase
MKSACNYSRERARAVTGELLPNDLTFWEEVAKTRWGSYLTREQAQVLDRACGILGEPGLALEVGAEGGRWSALLRSAGWNLICTDTDPHALAVCAERLPEARCVLVRADDTCLPCETDAAKLVLVYEVPPVTQSAWFPCEAARVLKPGGVLVCSADNPHSMRAQTLKVLGRLGPHHQTHRGRYSGPAYSLFRESLATHGFNVLFEVGLGWCPFSRKSNSFLIPPCVTLERISGLRNLPRLSPLVLLIAQKTSVG